MEVDDGNANSLKRVKEGLGEDVHPASEDNHVRLFGSNLVAQVGVITSPSLADLVGVLLAGGVVALVDEVEVLRGHTSQLGALGSVGRLAVDNDFGDAGIGDPPIGTGVENGLQVGPVAGGHDEKCSFGHGDG